MKENELIRRERMKNIAGTVILVIAAAIVFALIFFGLYKIKLIKLPDSLDRLLGGEQTEAPVVPDGSDAEGNRIFASLTGEPTPSGDYVIDYEVTADGLLEILDGLTPVPAYYAEQEIELTGGVSTLTRSLKLKRDGDKYTADIRENGQLTETMICDGENILCTDYSASAVSGTRKYGVSDDFSLESLLGLPLLREALTADNVTELEVALLRADSDNYYYVTYTYSDVPQREVIYVSVKYGLIVTAETYYNDVIVYRLTTSLLSDSVSFGKTTFEIAE